MNQLLISIGTIGLVALLHTTAHAQTPSLYQKIHSGALQAYPDYSLELEPFAYTVQAVRSEFEDVEAADVEAALDGSYLEDCEDIACTNRARAIATEYSKAAEYREFSRQLQHIAQSYEAGSMGITGHPNDLTQSWPSVSGLWQSGVDMSLTPLPSSKIRYEPLDEAFDGQVGQIRSRLKDLETSSGSLNSKDQIYAAVYMYRHGVKSLVEAEACASYNSRIEPEAYGSLYFTRRYCDLETAMDQLRLSLELFDYDPPLQPSEQVIFTSELLEELDVYIWMRNDDVGLNWIQGLEAPHLAYAADGILTPARWDYPPPLIEPDVFAGICSHPVGKQGYLCRPVTAELCPVADGDCVRDPASGACFDPNNSSTDRSVIGLTTCQAQNFDAPIRTMPAGQNICQVGGWLEEPTEEDGYDDASIIYLDDDPGENPDIKDEKNECSNCVVDFYCAETCGTMGSNGGYAFPKDNDGVTKVCLPSSPSLFDEALVYYLGLHEAVHAQQICGLPPNDPLTTTREQCCATEREAYLVMCNALWEDGILQRTDFTVDECASMFSNNSCASYGANACTVTEVDTSVLLEDLSDILEENRDDLQTPLTCQQTISEPTEKLKSLVFSTAPVCSPNCTAKYSNTIGNNLCYIGQCAEQSWEQNRVVPGRATTTTQAQAFPWEACMNPDPQLGTITTKAEVSTNRLPSYNPYAVIQGLDQDLCQQNGYPLLTPPVLCMYDEQNQLNLLQSEVLLSTAQLEQNVLGDAFERKLTTTSFSNIGNRIGSSIYNDYLETAVLSMNEALKNIKELMRQMGEIEFPTVMCPREQIEDCSYFIP